MPRKITMIVLLCLLFVGLHTISAQSTINDDLQALLDEYRTLESPAVSLMVWTPDATYSAASGVVDLDSRIAVTIDDRFRLGSVSKTYMAVAALQLVEAGLIDIDAPLDDYLPATVINNIDGADSVTVRHLLTMTSGLAEYLLDDFWDAVIDNPTYTWTAIDAIEQYVYGEPAIFAPGEDFEYTNTNYLLLQIIAESVTGEPLHVIFRENLLNPIGAENTYTQIGETLPGEFVHGYEDLDGDGEIDDAFGINDGAGLGDGALIANAADVVHFYQALFWEQTLLTEDTLAMMLQDPIGSEYGMGIEVMNDEDYGVVYGHSGSVLGFTSDARYFVDEDAIVVLLHADLELDTDLMFEALDIVLEG